MFLAFCILYLVVGFLPWIPILGAAAVIARFVLFILVINSLCNAINNLPAYSGISRAPGTG